MKASLATIHLKTCAAAASLALLSTFTTPACAIVLDAISDVFLRERTAADAATTFENDLISVWNSHGNDTLNGVGKRRYGVVEFDVSSLSGVQINSATLSLWNGMTGFSDQNKAIKQSALYINTTGGTPAANLTWNLYQSEYQGSAVALGGLGSFNLPAQPAPNAYSNSAAATIADRTVISNAASSGNQRFTLVMIADEATAAEYAHSWGDGPDGLDGMNPQLLINEATEQVVLTLRVNTTTGAMSILNPGTDPVVNTMIDIDGYVINSPAGSLNPAGFTGISGTGPVDWQIISPTSANLSELNRDSSTVFSEGNSRSLGTGFTPGASPDAGLTFTYNVSGGAPAVGIVEYVSGGLTGDYNGNGSVDADDYVVWRNGGSPDSSQNGYSQWRANFGMPAGAGTSLGSSNVAVAASVPEPNSFGLLVGLLTPAMIFQWRKHS